MKCLVVFHHYRPSLLFLCTGLSDLREDLMENSVRCGDHLSPPVVKHQFTLSHLGTYNNTVLGESWFSSKLGDKTEMLSDQPTLGVTFLAV